MNLLEDANRKAEVLDGSLSSLVNAMKVESAKKLFHRLRNYLIEQCRSHQAANDIFSKIRLQPSDSNGIALILLGPSIDKGPSSAHFNFDSGARLSFLIAVRESPSGSELVTFRFHFHIADNHSPSYLRFDLNSKRHATPLREPRCHLHPGLEEVRIPLPILHPVEILDRIFFVIEPAL